MSEEAKFRFATCILCDRVNDWWCKVIHSLESDAIESMSWEDFFTRFKREFVPVAEVQQLTQEYLALKKTSEMVAKITAKFKER